MPVSGVSHLIEHRTGWSIKKFVRTARRYRTVRIQAERQMKHPGFDGDWVLPQIPVT